MEPINPDLASPPVDLAAASASEVDRPAADASAAEFPERSPALAAADLRSLSLLFGLIYFLQSIANPLDGLATQPVRALLKSLRESPAEITAFTALLSLPWALKPLYGLLTDFVPLGGYRRKSYLIGTSLAVALGFLALYWFPPKPAAYGWLLPSLLLSAVGVSFANVVLDALLVERGQPGGFIGRLQSVQWAAIYAASILTGVAGGYLSAYRMYHVAFLLCGLGSLAMLAAMLIFIREPRRTATSDGWSEASRSLLATLRSPVLRSVCLFCLLFEFNPFSNTVLYLHLTNDLGFSEQFYGLLNSIVAVASVLACIAFGLYSHRISLRKLLHLSIGLGMLSTLVYAALDGAASALVVSFIFGFAYMTAVLIQVQLAAQACPAVAAGTIFALIMATSNLGSSLATWAGGHLYEQGMAWWGHEVGFLVLLVVGAACTATCWLVLPLLPSNLLD
jgi:MFS family permease